jgi:hypothetical protein
MKPPLLVAPDPAPRQSRWHRRILHVTPIAGTRSGHYLELECGHRPMAFGALSHLDGRALCLECKERDTKA